MEGIDNLALLSLNVAELRTLLAMRHFSDAQGTVEASTDEVANLTGYSPATLRRALRGLESDGFVVTVRTKRNFGKYSYSKYTLVSPPLKNERWADSPALKNERSTYDSNSSNSNNLNSYTSTNMYNYIDSHMVEKSEYKEVVLAQERWKPRGEDTTGDDNIGGFGLFEDEKPAVQKKLLSTDKRDPKTRGRRPQEEWTAADVAVEFSHLLCKKYPYLPGTLQTSPLRGALAANRKKYGYTPLVELELLRLFIGDGRNHSDAETKPDMLYKRYLRMFQTHMDEALKNLGMPSRKELANPELVHEKISEYLYASDGREFDNSIPGRRRLEQYEEKLRVNEHA
ncbi:hypothetical protein UFOVP45_52 [uncultured Caudovirales phage]|uniref:Helix-turn-helix domain containing protein n=1 Tax=uncultured Caudovirales phage TaxID=2100421 RepID=A0A6J5KRM3_9CAUD|nr:hypothetical protein UFOVP45_52 [uncultured Caudovirales phage]